MSVFTPKLTLSPENQFTFTCPIFKANTKISACLKLRDLVWKGKKTEVRKGCQACLSASKCPIYWVMRDMTANGTDPYASTTPVQGALEPQILNHIAPIIVPSRTLDDFQVDGREREIIVALNASAGPATADAIAKANKRRRSAPIRRSSSPAPEPVKLTSPTETTPSRDKTVEAAMSGDMAAAVSLNAA